MKKEYTDEEKAAYKAGKQKEVTELKTDLGQVITDLAAQINAGKSEHFLAYLKFCATLHSYSARNAALIEMQCRRRCYIDVNHVASFATWRKHGYIPKKDEKGLAVLVPVPFRKEKGQQEEDEESVVGVVFRVGYVFADCQVVPLRKDVPTLPIFFRPQVGDYEVPLARLLAAIRADGIRVEEEHLYRGQQGYSAGKLIVLKSGLASADKFSTLVHEYAHELLHKGLQLPKEIKECHAESIAYVVCRHYGLENTLSADYLLSWHVDEKLLMSQLEIVQNTAKIILQKIGLEAPVTESEAA